MPIDPTAALSADPAVREVSWSPDEVERATRHAEFAGELTRIALIEHRDPRVILNVNFPVGEFKGVKVAKLGKRALSNAERTLKGPAEMARLFADDPEAVGRTPSRSG